jgi:hypothetical protein
VTGSGDRSPSRSKALMDAQPFSQALEVAKKRVRIRGPNRTK